MTETIKERKGDAAMDFNEIEKVYLNRWPFRTKIIWREPKEVTVGTRVGYKVVWCKDDITVILDNIQGSLCFLIVKHGDEQTIKLPLRTGDYFLRVLDGLGILGVVVEGASPLKYIFNKMETEIKL